MSRAFQRAKERENRTPYGLVMGKTVKGVAEMYRGRTSGVGAGYPGPDVQNRARNALQEPNVRANGRISGAAGCPGPGVAFFSLSSLNTLGDSNHSSNNLKC